MNFEQLGNIGEFISAIAVLASLIYVAIQIRQNSKETRLSNVQNLFDAQRDMMLEAMKISDLLHQARKDRTSLTPAELSKVTMYRLASFRTWMNTLDLSESVMKMPYLREEEQLRNDKT